MEQTNKTVCAVVVTYNRKELLRECIIALKESNYDNLKILIVDNFSTDGTKEFISDLVDGSKVLYANTGENLGGAGGFNFGMKKAVEMNCDYVWIMDDDCIVQTDSLSKLIQFAKELKDDFGFLSSVVKWTDGSICVMNAQRVSLSTEITDFTKNQKIKLASFVSLFIKRETIEQFGLPIKDFFIWGDDWEYSSRISKKTPCYLVANSIVTHKCKTNMGVDIVKESSDRIDRYFYAYRNEGYFYKQNGLKGKIYYFLKRNLHKFKIKTSKDCKENKKKKLAIIKKGVKASKKFNPPIEYAYGKNTKVNVTEFFGEPLSYGGQEAFILNMYKNFSCEKVKYTFVTPFNCDNKSLQELTETRKDKITAYNYKFNSKKRKLYILKAIKNHLRTESCDVIHIHSGSIFTLFFVSKIAKKMGVKKVIVHSHCSGEKSFTYKLIKKYSNKRIEKYADVFFACSKLAGKWKFPKNVIDNGALTIINNGINLNNFSFNFEKRIQYRKDLNLGDSLVLLNVGRMEYEKNQEYIVEIAKKLLDEEVDFKIIIVGEGSLKDALVSKIKEYNLNDKFILLEKRTDVAEILMASDVFVFPSHFEGLGLVAIESQATGLPTICSKNIMSEINITDIIRFVDLEKLDEWLDTIMQFKKLTVNREEYAELIAKAGYDAKTSAEILEKTYLQ